MQPKDESDFQTPTQQGKYERLFFVVRQWLKVALSAVGCELAKGEGWAGWQDPDAHELLYNDDGDVFANDKLYSQLIPESPLAVGFYAVDLNGNPHETEINVVVDIGTPTAGDKYEPPGMDVSELAVMKCDDPHDAFHVAMKAAKLWCEWSIETAMEAEWDSRVAAAMAKEAMDVQDKG